MAVYQCLASQVGELWSLRDDVLIESEDGAEPLVLFSRWGETAVRAAGPLLREALRRMQFGPVSLENLEPGAAAGVRERAALLLGLGLLPHLVVRSLAAPDGEGPLLSVVPITRDAVFRPQPLSPDTLVRLSRYTVLRSRDGVLTAESPLSMHRVLAHRPEAAALLATLAAPRPAQAVEADRNLPPDLARAALAYLLAGGVAVSADPDGAGFAEDADPVLRLWSAGDLMFHSRSTQGRHDEAFGATYPADALPAEPLAARPAAGPATALPKPRLGDLLAADPPFAAVLEARGSVRRFTGPPSLPQLGELLYRTVRTRALIGTAGADPRAGRLLDRPYPSGGAIHELEFFVTVGDCDGLEPDVYAYNSAAHALLPIGAGAAARARLLERARLDGELEDPPPVLITVTARFGRVLHKYSGLGYALVLKNVGVVTQTLYLAATAMGLGGCALGAGEIEETSAALGLDWRAESAVGGFVLGCTDPVRGCGTALEVRPVNDPQWRTLSQLRINGTVL